MAVPDFVRILLGHFTAERVFHIAREYGIPAVANVRYATRRLKTGDHALLNATEGFVRIL
jgi:phosphoenolpyruvate-protein kinase (PTS system EI component)